MCGIVAAVSNRNIVPVLVEGLKRLESRGYDSCGVAVHQGDQLRRTRSTHRVAELGLQRRAQFVMVLDDAVVYQGDTIAREMRVGVV